jgi:sec-independent protein translocase protein TatA
MFDNPIAIGVVVVIVALLIAGPKRLPSFGRGLGSGMREFKDGITGEAKEFKEGITGESEQPKPDEGQVSLSPAPGQAPHSGDGSSPQTTGGSGRSSEPIA